MDPAKYHLDVRSRGKPRVGCFYIITHSDQPAWKEGSVQSHSSADEAKKAARGVLLRLANSARRQSARRQLVRPA